MDSLPISLDSWTNETLLEALDKARERYADGLDLLNGTNFHNILRELRIRDILDGNSCWLVDRHGIDKHYKHCVRCWDEGNSKNRILW